MDSGFVFLIIGVGNFTSQKVLFGIYWRNSNYICDISNILAKNQIY